MKRKAKKKVQEEIFKIEKFNPEGKRCCYNCSHCHRESDDVDTAGECRINPPEIVRDGQYGQWPTVVSSDWCSKHCKKVI